MNNLPTDDDLFGEPTAAKPEIIPEPTAAAEDCNMGFMVEPEIVPEPTQELATTDSGTSGLIALALNKDLDIAIFNRLMEMKDQEEEKTARSIFNTAMARVQHSLQPVIANADNDHTGSRYAKLNNIVCTLAPIYTDEGFSVSFGTDECTSQRLIDAGWFRVTGELAHAGGYTKPYHVDLPADTTGPGGKVNKTAIHGAKSAISYARVILMGLMFNFTTSEDVDNDGNQGDAFIPLLTEKQVIYIQDHVDSGIIHKKRFLAFAGYATLDEIPATEWPRLEKLIDQKRAAQENHND